MAQGASNGISCWRTLSRRYRFIEPITKTASQALKDIEVVFHLAVDPDMSMNTYQVSVTEMDV